MGVIGLASCLLRLQISLHSPAPESVRRGSTSASPTSPRSPRMRSSTPPTGRCSAAAEWTAPFTAPPDRSCWPNVESLAAASRFGQDHSRLSPAGDACHSRRRPGLEWRAIARRRVARVLLSHRSRAAAEQRLASIAFPAISTGVYAFPADRAARIAVGTVAAELGAADRGLTHVVFCCFARGAADHHLTAFAELGLT
jgi:macro domain-containing protein